MLAVSTNQLTGHITQFPKKPMKPYIKMEDIQTKAQPFINQGKVTESACWFYVSFAGKLVSSYLDKNKFQRVNSNSLTVKNQTIEKVFGLTRRERERRLKMLCDIGFLKIERESGIENRYIFNVGVSFGIMERNNHYEPENLENGSVQDTLESEQGPCTPSPSEVYRPPHPYISTEKRISSMTTKKE